MCESRIRSPEKYISSHLPRASTFSTLRPTTPWSTSTRERRGRTDSNEVTVCSASARFRVRAARKMVSPSGMSRSFLNVWRVFVFDFLGGFFGNDQRLSPAHLVTQHGIDEACLLQNRGQKMFAGGRIVDFAN